MDILERISAYDCSYGGHSDAAQGSAYDLLDEANAEIEHLRAALKTIAGKECQHPAAFADLNCTACIADEALNHEQTEDKANAETK